MSKKQVILLEVSVDEDIIKSETGCKKFKDAVNKQLKTFKHNGMVLMDWRGESR